MKKVFKITGLDCAGCAGTLENAIQRIDGVNSVNISFIMQKLELNYDESKEKEIFKNLKKVIKRERPDASIEL